MIKVKQARKLRKACCLNSHPVSIRCRERMNLILRDVARKSVRRVRRFGSGDQAAKWKRCSGFR